MGGKKKLLFVLVISSKKKKKKWQQQKTPLFGEKEIIHVKYLEHLIPVVDLNILIQFLSEYWSSRHFQPRHHPASESSFLQKYSEWATPMVKLSQ